MRFKKIVLTAVSLVIALITVGVGTRAYLEYATAREAGHEIGITTVFDRVVGSTDSLTVAQPPVEQPKKWISLLSGQECQASSTHELIATMIENLPASRPQMAGLVEAPLVYEALAEGGITRFLAIWDCQNLTRVGPIRSARPYYVDWASEYGGAYAHAGGSDQALAMLATAPLFNIDEGNAALSRDFRFTKPHNLFADLTLIRKGLQETKWVDKLMTPRFGALGLPPPVTAKPIKSFSLNFSTADFRVQYSWDALQKNFGRNLAGIPHVDEKNQPVRPTNIIIQFTEYDLIDPTSDKGRLKFRTEGTGTAWFFSGGKFWQGTWSKVPGGVTTFIDSDGIPVSLLPGQTFIEVISDPARVQINE